MQITMTPKLYERLVAIGVNMAPGLGHTPSVAETVERLARCYEVQHEVLVPGLYRKKHK